MKQKFIAFGMPTLLVFFLFTGASCRLSVKPASETKPVQKNFSWRTEWHWNGGRIRGTLHNMNEEHISSVFIEFALVDRHMMPIRRVSTSTDQGIEPYGQWNFEIDGGNDARVRNVQIVNTEVK